jgi:glycosyltransferase involved in cell wall biosynthesis
MPTYNRRAALERTLPGLLALDGLAELVVVDDGSGDGTADHLTGLGEPRLRVLRHEVNRGQQAARNTGLAATRSAEWVLMVDDDCSFPADYGRTLLRVAEETGADLVGAPWVHAVPGGVDEAVAAGRARPVDRFTLDTHPGAFPPKAVETPFMPALFLARRALFEQVWFQSSYGGNGWREETDLTVSALRAGFRCVLTPDTYSFQTAQWDGGARRGRLAYEFWCVRNNAQFLRKHGAYLHGAGHIDRPVVEQARFVRDRARPYVRALLSRLPGRRS